jgi:hypothetical protein
VFKIYKLNENLYIMSHRDILAKISGNRAYVLDPRASWNSEEKIKPRPNLIPKFSSQAEIRVVASPRPDLGLPPLEVKAMKAARAAKAESYLKSFVLSSWSASFGNLLIECDSPEVVR